MTIARQKNDPGWSTRKKGSHHRVTIIRVTASLRNRKLLSSWSRRPASVDTPAGFFLRPMTSDDRGKGRYWFPLVDSNQFPEWHSGRKDNSECGIFRIQSYCIFLHCPRLSFSAY